MNVFDVVTQNVRAVSNWKQEPLPMIRSAGIRRIQADFETNGLRWWAGDLPGGIGLCLPSDSPLGYRTQYNHWGHEGEPNNFDPEVCKEWMRREFEGVHIENLNTRFEIHMALAWGVDFEAMGCTVSDVGHDAALLDDHRQKSSLEALCADLLKDEKKIKAVQGVELNPLRMMQYPAWMVAVRAEADVRQVRKLSDLMMPRLVEEDLMRVKKLEEEVIYVVCEMERNGSPMDMELLQRFLKESAEQLVAVNKEIASILGRSYQIDLFEGGRSDAGFINPRSSKEMEALFKHLKLPISRLKSGAPSFTADVLKAVHHPVIDLVRKASQLSTLRSKYLVNDAKRVSQDNVLRYSLHQLRAVKDENDDKSEVGTVSGRFSSTEVIKDEEGVNIQQRMKVEKQRVKAGYDEEDDSHDDEIFIIRSLHIPDRKACPSAKWLRADARQIEYRLFAHHVNDPRVIQAYKDDPLLSFHRYTHGLIRPFNQELTYRQGKDMNFMRIYGGGIKKLALMMGFISAQQFAELTRDNADKSHPLLKRAVEVDNLYSRILPGVKPLLRRASHLAMTECNDYCKPDDLLHRSYEHRGYVKTILGRRSRFPGGYRNHKAFNCVVQGTAADIMKQKLVELHRARNYTGFLLRFTVHDEVDGDARLPETQARVSEILDSQSFPSLRVPILWETTVGENWKEASV